MRNLKLASEAAKQASKILQKLFPNMMVSIVRAEMMPKNVALHLYVSIYGDDKEKSFKDICEACKLVKFELAKKIRIRKMPSLFFRLDDGIEYSQKITNIISTMKGAVNEVHDNEQ